MIPSWLDNNLKRIFYFINLRVKVENETIKLYFIHTVNTSQKKKYLYTYRVYHEDLPVLHWNYNIENVVIHTEQGLFDGVKQ